MTLLDIGCGWGSTMRHAIEKYDVNVIGLTLSENQLAHDKQKFAEMDSPRTKDVRLQGWEQFDEPVDRIVSLGAFEHFADGIGTYERYADFFKMCYNVMPDDGVMLLHSIVVPTAEEGKKMGLKTTMSLVRFISFIRKEIYPGGRLPTDRRRRRLRHRGRFRHHPSSHDRAQLRAHPGHVGQGAGSA